MRNDKVREEYRRTLENLHKPGYLGASCKKIDNFSLVWL